MVENEWVLEEELLGYDLWVWNLNELVKMYFVESALIILLFELVNETNDRRIVLKHKLERDNLAKLKAR